MQAKLKIFLLFIVIIFMLADKSYSEKAYWPSFHINKKIKYRLFYGNNPEDFIDIARADCIFIDDNLKCGFTDLSPIENISIRQGDPCLEIEKAHSIWTICSIYDMPENWYLTYIKK